MEANRANDNGLGIHSIVTGEPPQKHVCKLPPSFQHLVDAHLRKVADAKEAQRRLDAERAREIELLDDDAPDFPAANNDTAPTSSATSVANAPATAIGDTNTQHVDALESEDDSSDEPPESTKKRDEVDLDDAPAPASTPKKSGWQTFTSGLSAAAKKTGSVFKYMIGQDAASKARKKKRKKDKIRERDEDVRTYDVSRISKTLRKNYMKAHEVKPSTHFKPLELRESVETSLVKFEAAATTKDNFYDNCQTLIAELGVLFENSTAGLNHMCGTRVCPNCYPCAARGYIDVYNSYMKYIGETKRALHNCIMENSFRLRADIHGVKVEGGWIERDQGRYSNYTLSEDLDTITQKDRQAFEKIDDDYEKLDIRLNSIRVFGKRRDRTRECGNAIVRGFKAIPRGTISCCKALHQKAIDTCLSLNDTCDKIWKNIFG